MYLPLCPGYRGLTRAHALCSAVAIEMEPALADGPPLHLPAPIRPTHPTLSLSRSLAFSPARLRMQVSIRMGTSISPMIGPGKSLRGPITDASVEIGYLQLSCTTRYMPCREPPYTSMPISLAFSNISSSSFLGTCPHRHHVSGTRHTLGARAALEARCCSAGPLGRGPGS